MSSENSLDDAPGVGSNAISIVITGVGKCTGGYVRLGIGLGVHLILSLQYPLSS